MQRGELDRLHQMLVDPRLLGALAIGFLAPARERDDRGTGSELQLPNAPGGIEAVQPRHADVHEDHVRLECLNNFNRLDSVARLTYLVPEHAQERFERS